MSAAINRTYPLTRIVCAIVFPVLVLAFLILYFFPEQSGERFAWLIQPNMSALFIGAGYLGGGLLLLQAALGRPWSRVQHGFPLVTVFTVSMFAATVLHWDRFDIRHFPFQLWLGLYIVSPFLIAFVWLSNRKEDPGTPEPEDRVVPAAARTALQAIGAALGIFSLLGWFAPDTLIGLWVWKLTPLTARVFAGWFALMAAGGFLIGRETRWSAWKYGVQSIFVWHLLIAIGGLWNTGDFGDAGYFNWYIILVWIGLAGMAGLYLQMSRRTDRAPAQHH